MGSWSTIFTLFFASKKRVTPGPTAAGAIDQASAAPAPVPALSVPEKLADLKHPDTEHLLLGINLEGLREACELVGFPYLGIAPWVTYKREDHPEMAWLDEAYPGPTIARFPLQFLGYDFCCAVKAWLKANGHENESICQVLLKRGSKNVGPANLFYSHMQGVRIWETLQRMREGIALHKAQLPQASEAAKTLVAEQRARLSELEALYQAAEDDETKATMQTEGQALVDMLTICPADEAHLFFWLGVPPPQPIRCSTLARSPNASRVCHGRLHHAKTMRARF